MGYLHQTTLNSDFKRGGYMTNGEYIQRMFREEKEEPTLLGEVPVFVMKVFYNR